LAFIKVGIEGCTVTVIGVVSEWNLS